MWQSCRISCGGLRSDRSDLRDKSREFYDIGQGLNGNICTARPTLLLTESASACMHVCGLENLVKF